MHCERNRELYAGSADVLIRNRRQARAICSQGKIVSRFALSADGDVRAPGRMRLPNSENCITNPTSRAAMIVSLLSPNFLHRTLVR